MESRITQQIVRVIGGVSIAHGLSHAVVPMRDSIAPALAAGDWTPVVLYSTSMMGFVAAGLGLLGVRPLCCAISPLLVLSSGLSFVAIQRLGHPDFWPGATLDVAFFVLGLWRSYAGWPAVVRRRSSLLQVVGLIGTFTFLGYLALGEFSQWRRNSPEFSPAGEPAVRVNSQIP